MGESDSSSSLAQQFERLQDKVLAKRPVLAEIIRKRGDKTLLDYANDYVDVNLNPPILERQSELLSTIHEATKDRFGEEVADGVVAQLQKYYFVSTADHVGPIVNPFFVNANLLTSLAMRTHNDPALQYVIVLACANISLNNSTFPRGLLFNTAQGDDIKLNRLSFLPSNAHSCSVYNFRPYTDKEIIKVKKRLQEMVKDEGVSKQIADPLDQLITEIYADPAVLACDSYREQIGRTNLPLWQKVFRSSETKLPDLIYLDQENIVVRLLEKYHLHQDTIINHILFDDSYEHFITDYFEGIFGSFSRKDASGTYLFWALPKGEEHKKQLWRKGNRLVTKDEAFSVELQPEALLAAMKSGELIPSLLLNFVTLSFYYGLKCLGGFNQVNYLTLMKNAYIKMNVDLGDYRSIEVCARAQTKEIGEGMSMALLGYGNKRTTLATGLDLFLHGTKETVPTLRTISQNITLGQALSPLMPEMYRLSYDDKELEPDLANVTDEDVSRLLGLTEKMTPCTLLP